jgi:hypothetical protein
VRRWRDYTYRRTPERRLTSAEQAVAFADEVGFCFFWPIDGVELPSLWATVAGDRPVADEHDDPGHVTWGWKDTLLSQKRWYYAKLLRRRATIISLETLPYFYALSENFGDPEDYLLEYEAGTLTAEARAIYEALLEKGPLDTPSLRREARLAGKDSKGRFERGLVELQIGLKALPVGVGDAGAWHYSHIYDLLIHWLPDLPERARPIGRGQARRALVRRYLENVGAATPEQVARLFGWPLPEVNKALATLAGEGVTLPGVSIEGLKGEHVAVTQLVNLRSYV